MSGAFSEMARKWLHVAMGGFALLLGTLAWPQAFALAVAAFLHNLYILPLYAGRTVFREPGAGRRDLGILLYPASIAVLILIFRHRLEIVAAAWGLLAFGDGFSTIVGKTVRGPRLPWNRAKTWSGFLAFIVCGFLAANFLYVFTVLGRVHAAAVVSAGADAAEGAAEPAGSGTLTAGEAASVASEDGGRAEISPDGAFSTSERLAKLLMLGRDGPSPRGPAGFLTRAVYGSLWDRFFASWIFGWCGMLALAIAATALLASTLESLPLGVDDNALVPLGSAGLLYAFTLYDPAAWEASRDDVVRSLPWAIGINAALAAAAYAARSVSLSGVVGGIFMGGALYAFGGWRSFLMLVVFFVLGTAATKAGFARKASLGIAQERGGRRGARNAVANCGMGALLAFVAAVSPHAALVKIGLVAAFATAACDTVSSEIGQAYGRTTYLITTFRRVRPGTDGAVSLEGTLAGVAAGMVVALAAVLVGLVPAAAVPVVALAAVFGSTLESVMGATWERAKLIDNEAINFVNTLAGALFAMGIAASLR